MRERAALVSSPHIAANRTRTIGRAVAAALIVGLVAALIWIQWSSTANDLSFSRHLLSNAQYRWEQSHIAHYRLTIEQRAAAGVCRYQIEVSGDTLSSAQPACPGSRALSVPDMFAALDGLLSSGQSARSLSVRGIEDGQRPVIENILSVPCGANEAAGSRVEIVYDQQAGYPHLIRTSPANPDTPTSCDAAAGGLPDVRVVALEALP